MPSNSLPREKLLVYANLEAVKKEHYLLSFKVQDTGIGIPQEKLEHLFSPFSQLDTSTTRRYGGTGLGLSISKQFVELMHGSIEVQSEPNQGSTFSFTITLGVPTNPVSRENEKHLLENGNVAIIDRHEPTRRSLKMILENMGAKVYETETIDELVALIQKQADNNAPLDWVLIDIDSDRSEVERKLLGLAESPQYQGLHFTPMFSLGEAVDPGSFILPRTIGFITKPIRSSNLLKIVQANLSSTSMTEEAAHDGLLRSDEEPLTRKPLRILLVDDVKVNIMVAGAMLTSLGHEVHSEDNGMKALEALRTHDFDLVFMDCQMPEMNGYRCTQEIRKKGSGVRNPRIPVIAMTAHAMIGDREKCLEAGMDDYVSKPITPDMLRSAIDRWKGRKSDAVLS